MALPSLSSTVKVKVSVPFQSCTEPNVTSKPFMDTEIFSFPETVSAKESSSISPMYGEKSSTRLSSSKNTKTSGNTMVGGSFTEVTVSTKVSVAV